MEVCAVRDAATAVDIALLEQPDVCIVDARMEPDPLQTVTAIATEMTDVPVVILGTNPSDQDLLDALTAGASGYLSAHTPHARLEPTLRDVANGRSAFPRRLDGLLMAAVRRSMGPHQGD